ncbi:MAG TPA: hypothetical protein VJU58_14670 [Microbacterium sp.]|nr:hypothetical protein [Microbacterium sp.]
MTKAPWSDQKAARRLRDPDAAWAAEIRDRVLADCHEYQAEPVQAVCSLMLRYFTLLAGRSGGKTTVYKAIYIIQMAAIPGARFIYGAPTREMATDLLWDPMKETCERLGIEASFQEVKRVCTFHRTGARLKLVGLDDKREMGKQRGQPFNGVGVDEICEFPPQLIEWFVDRIVGPRLGERAGWLGLGSTPGVILRGLFYEATRPGSKLHVAFRELAQHPGWQGWVSFHWNARMVSELPDAMRRYPAIVANHLEHLRLAKVRQWSEDNPIKRREHDGVWAADNTMLVFQYLPHKEGKPWNQWDPPRRGLLQLAVLPDTFTDYVYVIAFDEGYSDPFACNAFAFSPSDPAMEIFHIYGMERGPQRKVEDDQRPQDEREKMYARSVAQLLIGDELDLSKPGGLIGAIGEWPLGIEGDCGEQMELELGRVYGIQVVRFDRSHKYKATAIGIVNGDFHDGRIKILKGSPLEREITELQWTEDTYGNLVENKAQANHGSDTLIIARKIIGTLISTGTVQTPQSPAEKRAAAELKRQAAEPAPDDRDEEASQAGAFSGMLVGGFDDSWSNI